MPKKSELEKQIRQIANKYGYEVGVLRQGGGHEIWNCEGFTFPIPRHREIAEGTARKIIKTLTEHLDSLPETRRG